VPDPAVLYVDFTISAELHIPELERLSQLLSFAGQQTDLTGELGIWLCTDDEIADLHLRFMGIPGPTDVITFPAEDAGAAGYLGDIAVSTETAGAQSIDVSHSPEREVAFLCLHGLLHLAGLDDTDDDSRSAMLSRQEVILSEFERQHPGVWTATT
jgi:probable rRNA maturation factor